MQQMFYDESPYHILYYDNELDAYRTDKFAGWTNQPLDGGYPLFSYSVIDYQYLTDAKAPASPTPAASASAEPSQAVVTGSIGPTASTPPPSGSTSSTGSDPTVLILVAVVVAVAVAGLVIMGRRRRTGQEEE